MSSVGLNDQALSEAPVRRPILRFAVADYVSLTKPRIVLLLVLTALAAMLPAAHGLPRPLVALAVVAGGAFAAGGAHAINCWFDRDIDAAMSRTRHRPIPEGRMAPWHALLLGVVLNAAAFAILWLGANPLAAVLAICGSAIYVFVYTLWLKRTTPQNIVIGGAAGAIPPLVGWAAVTGSLNLAALSLFAFIFFWTPPHFWSLARLTGDDYSRAGVPMLPVVEGPGVARRQAAIYAVLAAATSLVPFFTGATGVSYLMGAVILGAGFVSLTLLDLANGRWTARVFRYSLLYMAGLFALLALSPFLP